MLVIDLYALQAVDILNLFDQICGQRFYAQQAQYVLRVRLAIGNHFTALHLFTFEHINVPPFRNQLFMVFALRASDDQTLFTFRFLTEADCSGALSQNGWLFRLSGFEQVSYSWQTPGDVAVFSRFLWNSCNHITDRHFFFIIQTDSGT